IPQAGEGEIAQDVAREIKRENAALRKRLKEIDDAAAAADLAKLGDVEKANRQLQAVQKQADAYRAKLAGMAVQIEAQKLGIVDPEVAATLISGKLEFDADGTPTNAADLLKDLAKAKPYLVSQAGGAGQGQQQPAGPNAGGATNPSRSAAGGGA